MAKLPADAAGPDPDLPDYGALRADLRLALNAGRMGVWSWDQRTGRVTWDETMAALFGLTLAEFDGTYDGWLSRIHPDDREESQGVVDRAVGEASPYTLVRRTIWPDGSVHWIEGRADVMTDADGAVVGARGVSMDVTEREEAAMREVNLRRDLALLAEAGVVLASTLEPELLLRRFTALVVPAIADACEIDVCERDGRLRRTVHAPGADEEATRRRELEPLTLTADHPIAEVVRTGRELVLGVDPSSNAAAWAFGPPELATSAAALGVVSAVVVPLVARGTPIGALALGFSSRRPSITHELELASELSRRFALAYDNARLHGEQRLIAETLQRSLLPASIPSVDGIEVAARYWVSGAGTEVGGDFYDVIVTSEDRRRVTVMIGDVCGKGAAAAALTALARHTLRAAVLEGVDPASSLAWLHRALEAEPFGTYVTAVVAELEIVDGSVRGWVAVGGHPRPIIRRRDGSTELLDDAGPPPGMPLWEPAPLNPIVLGDGDSLVLYTDGVTDVPGPAAIDDDELRDLIGQADADSPDAIADAISAAVSERRPHHERSDDTALIVLRADRAAVALDFPALRSSPALVRAWLTNQLGDDHPMLDDAVLGVSELVSNTVLHARGPGVARLRRRDGWLRVEVSDGVNDRLPSPDTPAPDALSGRGLHLIEQLADRWGVDRSGDGKIVWFELPDRDATPTVGARA